MKADFSTSGDRIRLNFDDLILRDVAQAAQKCPANQQKQQRQQEVLKRIEAKVGVKG